MNKLCLHRMSILWTVGINKHIYSLIVIFYYSQFIVSLAYRYKKNIMSRLLSSRRDITIFKWDCCNLFSLFSLILLALLTLFFFGPVGYIYFFETRSFEYIFKNVGLLKFWILNFEILKGLMNNDFLKNGLVVCCSPFATKRSLNLSFNQCNLKL